LGAQVDPDYGMPELADNAIHSMERAAGSARYDAHFQQRTRAKNRAAAVLQVLNAFNFQCCDIFTMNT
jgi:hypothetical protein